MIGQVHGSWTVVEYVALDARPPRTGPWLCECSCGRTALLHRHQIAQAPSCSACQRAAASIEDLALDVYDWMHFFHLRPVTFEEWRGIFRRGSGARRDSDQRYWERTKKSWDRAGVPFVRLCAGCGGGLTKGEKCSLCGKPPGILLEMQPAAHRWVKAILGAA